LEKGHFASQRQLFFQHLAQTSPAPLAIAIERAEGLYLYDQTGKSYLDLISGIGPSVLGHRPPQVQAAIELQLNQYWHTLVYGEFILNPQVDLAALITAQLPELDAVYLVNSGTEANEAAIKMARRATGRSQIISFHKSYHGNTMGSLSISGNETKKAAFRPLIPDVDFIQLNRWEDLDRITSRTAGVILEPVQGDAGVRTAHNDYLVALRNKCTEVGALLIFDEIQCGVGRTGSWYYFQQTPVVPDAFTTAKGFGGGLPIGALVASKELHGIWAHAPMLGHITTFGGNPVCSASALAVLETIESEKLMDQIPEKANFIRSRLNHPQILEIRNEGLMFAVDLKSEEEVGKLFDYCLQNGVIIYRFLSSPSSFRMAPPLTISLEELEFGMKVILEGLNALK
jgi:acetylornithine/succinyldiaminopimelate/putrescine aminotransferase